MFFISRLLVIISLNSYWALYPANLFTSLCTTSTSVKVITIPLFFSFLFNGSISITHFIMSLFIEKSHSKLCKNLFSLSMILWKSMPLKTWLISIFIASSNDIFRIFSACSFILFIFICSFITIMPSDIDSKVILSNLYEVANFICFCIDWAAAVTIPKVWEWAL